HHRAERRRALLRVEHAECVRVLEPAQGFSPAGWLDHLRVTGARRFWSYVSEKRSGLASALLLGFRDEVDDQRTEAFMQTGTVHILSISGLHVGILAAGLFAALRGGWMPRVPALCGAALIVCGYALLADAQAPVLRAALLVTALCLGL